MLTFVISFVFSTLTCLLIRHYIHYHGHASGDHDTDSAHKYHDTPVPRIGGVAVLAGLIAGTLRFYLFVPNISITWLLLVITSLPAFLVGLKEDLTKKNNIRERLIITILSAFIAGLLIDSWLIRSDIDLIDRMLKSQFFSIFLTCFAVAGLIHAYNIIDGYNGLSGVVALIVLMGIVYVAWRVGDIQISFAAIALAGAICGFLLWNYPFGLIFLGDGGAYLIGFMLAELSVLLVMRNNQVSAWFPFLLNFYPVFEMFYSIWRKKFFKKTPISSPDGLHLHMLVYKRLVKWTSRGESVKSKVARNALTSPYLWAFSCLTVAPAVIFWDNTPALITLSILAGYLYITIYKKIVRNQMPQWMKI